MMFRMLAVLAEFRRDVISERTTLALAHKKLGMKYAPVPFGYQEIEGRLEGWKQKLDWWQRYRTGGRQAIPCKPLPTA